MNRKGGYATSSAISASAASHQGQAGSARRGARGLAGGTADILRFAAVVAELRNVGARHEFDRDTNVVTVPIGYADGVPRALGLNGGEVLVHGRRRPIVGVITMDQLMVDVGDDEVAVGDDVVLIGSQGDEAITADEWAERLGTIAYEIVCGIGPRVPRHYRR